MSDSEAQSLGIPEDKRRYYVKVSNAKQNLTAHNGTGDWYQYRSVDLENGTPEYPEGDQVGVLVRWAPQNSLTGHTWEQVEAVLDKIEAGPGDGEYYTHDPKATRWVGKLLIAELGVTEEVAKLRIKEWMCYNAKYKKPLTTAPVLRTRDYISKERNNGKAKRLTVNPLGKAELKALMKARA
jgi:hypothetical protein